MSFYEICDMAINNSEWTFIGKIYKVANGYSFKFSNEFGTIVTDDPLFISDDGKEIYSHLLHDNDIIYEIVVPYIFNSEE